MFLEAPVCTRLCWSLGIYSIGTGAQFVFAHLELGMPWGGMPWGGSIWQRGMTPLPSSPSSMPSSYWPVSRIALKMKM